MDDWVCSNPGKCVSIHEMGKLFALVFTKSMMPENILSCFQCTGICLLNSMIFADHEFIPASVTDQPLSLAETNVLEGRSQSAPTFTLQVTTGTIFSSHQFLMHWFW